MFDLDEMLDCPHCGAEQAWEEALLGPLGTLFHFRCRNCGGQWSENAEERDDA